MFLPTRVATLNSGSSFLKSLSASCNIDFTASFMKTMLKFVSAIMIRAPTARAASAARLSEVSFRRNIEFSNFRNYGTDWRA
ncbi:MAG TPA: hypothetical protein VNJ49_15115 [Bradyrhizobium sp.]|nr:hypothetical protein [Bradyrhizobium sp.]